MKPKLSILVCRMPFRYTMWKNLQSELYRQILPYANQVQVLSDDRMSVTVGEKRNRLLNDADGDFILFHDDDDWPSGNYVELLMKAIESDCDCASLKGEYSVDGNFDGTFEHSLRYKEWKTTNNSIKYERFPNHLNLIRASIAKQFKFPEKSFGEDFTWSTKIHESGLLKTEQYIPEILYYYRYITNKIINMKYSQSDEQLFIEDYFSDKKVGKFIDIGAYDVFKFSNVRRLYELGFSGVLVEPAPQNYKAIAEHYADDERIKVLNVAIGETNGEIDFYDCNGDAISTTDEAHKAKWEAAGVKYTKIKVQQVSVLDFFNQYGKDVDFISIDTELTNMVVFRNIPDWVWEQIKMLVIEHDQNQEEIEKTLSTFGFSTLYVNSENIILAK